MMKYLGVPILFVLITLSYSVGFAQERQSLASTVLTLSEGDPAEFSILSAALIAADPVFLELLNNPKSSLTVFAPTDEAFVTAFLSLELEVEDVLADADFLNALLAYHIVPGVFEVEALMNAASRGARSVMGTFLPDQTFALSLGADSELMINESKVVNPDIMAVNGIIHSIDSVLIPALEAIDANVVSDVPKMSIADILSSATADDLGLSIFRDRVVADSELTTILNDNGPFTILIPTDEGFMLMGEMTGIYLSELQNDSTLFRDFLDYHLLPGTISTKTLQMLAEQPDLRIMTMLPGTTVSIDVQDNQTSVDEYVQILGDEIRASNGIIHVIDNVLLPPNR